MNIFLVQWNQIDYNIGSHFDGKIFTAPITGLYTFFTTAEHSGGSGVATVFVYLNGLQKFYRRSNSTAGAWGNVSIQTTLKVAQGDKVEVRFNGRLAGAQDANKTQFEGRLLSNLSE